MLILVMSTPSRPSRRLGFARSGYKGGVTFGTSIFVFAVGAILRYAVTATVSGIQIHTVGLILMIVGVLGFLVSIFYALSLGSRRVARERVIERDPPRTY